MMEQARKAQQAMLEKVKEQAAPVAKIEVVDEAPSPAPAEQAPASLEPEVPASQPELPAASVPLPASPAVPASDAEAPPSSPAPRAKRHKAKPIAV